MIVLKKILLRDIVILVFSLLIAVALSRSDLIFRLLTATQEYKLIGSFLAGLFYISAFTSVPATVVIYKLSGTIPIWELVILGGLGALIGDLVIFRFIRDYIAEDVGRLIQKIQNKKTGIQPVKTNWVMVILGAIVVAAPLPDEIGLTMMGLSKIKTSIFIPLSFILNAFGILVVATIARII